MYKSNVLSSLSKERLPKPAGNINVVHSYYITHRHTLVFFLKELGLVHYINVEIKINLL